MIVSYDTIIVNLSTYHIDLIELNLRA